MQIVTEIYVAPFSGSTDYIKLDLFNNESINLKYTLKDVTDLSKVFAPYSLSFSVQATPKNRSAFTFFGDTDVVKINKTGSYPCKIYTDGNLNLVGNLTLEECKYNDNAITSIQCSFSTEMKSLKDRIGDGLISELGSVLTGSTRLSYTPTVAKNSIESKQLFLKDLDVANSGTTSANDIVINYITPLASNNRVWSYEFLGDVVDNIAYKTDDSDPTKERAILTTELKPAISYRSLVEMMFRKYDLKVNLPLRNDPLFNDMYVWVSGNKAEDKLTNSNVLKFGSTFNTSYPQHRGSGLPIFPPTPDVVLPADELEESFPRKYTASNYTNIANGYDIIKINIGDKATGTLPSTDPLGRTSKSIRINVQLKNLQPQGTFGKISISLRQPNGAALPADCEEILNVTVDMVTGDNNLFIPVPDTLFDGYTADYSNYPTFEAYILFKSDLATWDVTNVFTQYRYLSPRVGANIWEIITQTSITNSNEKISASGTIDLVQSLPKMKVIDFFQSFLKTFNLSVFNPIVGTNELQILSPEDVNNLGKNYSKKEVDYTPFVNAKTYSKSAQDKFNKYNFKHATSKYKSNVDYLAGNPSGLEYGQVTQNNNNPKTSEYSVITNYTIIPPRNMINTNLITYYGFSNELTDQENRYTPINNELVLFVNNGLDYLNVELGFLMTETSIVPITSYMKLLPWIQNSKQGLGFSVLVDDVSGDYPNKQKTDSLYKRFYDKQTARLLDVNTLSHSFELFLPSSEIYVNPTRANEPPTGFRLQNDVIIGETRFTILDATIDITTGKTKLTLLNYTGSDITVTPFVYNPYGYDSTQYQTK